MTDDPDELPLLNHVLDSLAVGTVHLTETTLRGHVGLGFRDDVPATCVHHVQEGVTWLDGPGIEPRRLRAGDLAWVLRAGGHRGRTTQDAPVMPIEAATIVEGPGVGKRLTYGDGPVEARIFTSHLLWASADPHPLLDLLPRICVVRECELGGPVKRALELLTMERGLGAAGSDVVASRLTELLWIYVVRHAADTVRTRGLLQALAHPGVARAMAAITRDPARPWTLEQLARSARMSRTLFAQTFRDCVGLTPFAYLRRWRVHRAQELMREPHRSLEAVAAEVGYASPVSFSRAFAAVTGRTPGQWRRTALTSPARPSASSRG